MFPLVLTDELLYYVYCGDCPNPLQKDYNRARDEIGEVQTITGRLTVSADIGNISDALVSKIALFALCFSNEQSQFQAVDAKL